MLSIIVAKAKNNIIGKDNKIIWDIPEDLKYFKELTTGHNMIMGRKTFENFENISEDRNYIVFSQNPDWKCVKNNVRVVHSMLEIQEYIEDDKENFVIGGAMIYNLLMPHVKKMYVTEIDKEFEGDAFFPKINLDIWKEVSRKKGNENNEIPYNYDFVIYERK